MIPRTAADALAAARRVVVKVGSSLLLDAEGRPDAAFAAALAEDLARLRARGAGVALVSSGAVALGRGPLGFPPRRALKLEEKQAAAAAGQAALMRVWETALAPHGLCAAQVLLTRADTEARRAWLNARATLETLGRLPAVAVINENDTTATEELRFGDNDRLAARAAQMLRADLLVLLSDVDGLFTADPRLSPDAAHLPRVESVTPEVSALAGAADPSGPGSGGMATKLEAARMAALCGCATIIARGRPPGGGGPLTALAAGARATLVLALGTPQAAYKAWIAGGLEPKGALTVDAGAAAALREGRSLLPAGVSSVAGDFGKGDVVRVLGPAGEEIARGVCGHGAETARRLAGKRSDAHDADRPELIHRDDLVLAPA
jgi:glutamate 5-kinase